LALNGLEEPLKKKKKKKKKQEFFSLIPPLLSDQFHILRVKILKTYLVRKYINMSPILIIQHRPQHQQAGVTAVNKFWTVPSLFFSSELLPYLTNHSPTNLLVRRRLPEVIYFKRSHNLRDPTPPLLPT
jgi:hypothetical protein